MRFLLSAIALLMISAGSGAASDCKVELFKTFLSSESEYKNDFRFSNHVTNEQFESSGKSGEAGGEIFGIGSAEGSFNNYNNRSSKITGNEDYQSSTQQYENVLWTGLDDNGAKAYAECIRGNNFGLFLTPGNSTSAEQEFRLYYKSVDGNPLSLKWNGNAPSMAQFPKSIRSGQELKIVVSRPSKGAEYLISATGGNATTDSILLAYLPKPIVAPQWRELKVSLKNDGSTYPVGSDVVFKEISYAATGAATPHRHSFSFVVSLPNNSERFNPFFENDKDWTKQIEYIEMSGKVIEYAFWGFNDGYGRLSVRIWQ